MKVRTRILICLVPYVALAWVTVNLAYPAFLKEQDKSSELSGSNQELAELAAKVSNKIDEEKRYKSLEAEINLLHNAVPKQPELDLLMLDLERMCAETNVDLVGVEKPDQDILSQLEKTDESTKKTAPIENEVKPNNPSPNAKTNPPKNTAAKTNKKEPNDLQKIIRQVYITGNYRDVVNFFKKVESYQRILGLDQLVFAVESKDLENSNNKAVDRITKLKLKQPLACFLMTIYYLP